MNLYLVLFVEFKYILYYKITFKRIMHGTMHQNIVNFENAKLCSESLLRTDFNGRVPSSEGMVYLDYAFFVSILVPL